MDSSPVDQGLVSYIYGHLALFVSHGNPLIHIIVSIQYIQFSLIPSLDKLSYQLRKESSEEVKSIYL